MLSFGIIIELHNQSGASELNDVTKCRIQKHIKEIAKREGKTEDEIYREMKAAILFAKSSPNSEIQAIFTAIFGNDLPSVEEFVYEVALKTIFRDSHL